MFTNGDCTIYFNRDGKYIRQAVEDIYWQDSKQANVLKTGMSTADAVKIMIPASSADISEFTAGKDLITKGIIPFEFDNTNSQTISASLKSLNASHMVFTIQSADDKRYGSTQMRHWDLSGK